MKTPEEIKKGLECCNNMADGCMECPYETEGESGWHCVVERNIDALAYIQQLEEKAELYDKVVADALQFMRARVAAAKELKRIAERLETYNTCAICKHANETCKECNFEWRGVREVE